MINLSNSFNNINLQFLRTASVTEETIDTQDLTGNPSNSKCSQVPRSFKRSISCTSLTLTVNFVQLTVVLTMALLNHLCSPCLIHEPSAIGGVIFKATANLATESEINEAQSKLEKLNRSWTPSTCSEVAGRHKEI